jgi:hypothetical protein
LNEKNKINNTTKSGHNIDDVTDRRLSNLAYMFQEYPNIDITGNPQYPTLIMDNNKLLYTHIKNFDLSFLEDLPSTGYNPMTLFKKRISFNKKNIVSATDTEFNHYLKHYWTQIYTVQHSDTGLFISGYSKKLDDPDKGKILVPVFSKIKKKYCMEKSHAQDIINKYPDYPLVII